MSRRCTSRSSSRRTISPPATWSWRSTPGTTTSCGRRRAGTPDVDAARAKIVLLRDFDPLLEAGEAPDVGDPYYGGRDGFTDVLAQVERSCAGLLAAIVRSLKTGVPLAG